MSALQMAASPVATAKPVANRRSSLLAALALLALAVGDPGLVHLPGQAVAAVEANVHGEGKPGLHADMTEQCH